MKYLLGILLLAFNGFINLESLEKPLKILVLIIASDSPLYRGFENSWRSYMHLDPEHFESYFIKADPNLENLYLIKQDTIWSKTEENFIPGILYKTLLSLECFSGRLNEFDYILRTNLSSFFVFPRLLAFAKTLNKQKCYCGIHHGSGWPGHEAGFVCGAGIIMSRDLAKMLLDNKEKFFNRTFSKTGDFLTIDYDDLVIGDFFSLHQIPIVDSCYIEIYNENTWMAAIKDLPKEVFHFRIHTPEPRIKKELAIHSILLKRFYNKRISVQELIHIGDNYAK